MGVVALQREILIDKIENTFFIRIDLHDRKLLRLSLELKTYLFQMVFINMGITQRVDEVATLQISHLRYHLQQKCVRRNVERDSEENVCASLIELEAQFSIRHIKLEQRVAWGKCHAVYLCHVPCRNNQAAGIRVLLDHLHNV